MEYLGTLPGADLLIILPRLVNQGKQSGTLIAEKVNGDVSHRLILRDGALVNAQSSRRNDRIGDLLVKRRKITADQLELALAKQKDLGGKVPLGQILVDMQLIAADLIPHLVFHQVELVLYETLVWPEVRFQFQAEQLATQTDFIVPVAFEMAGGQFVAPEPTSPARSMRMLLQEAQEALPRYLKVRQFLPNPHEVPTRTTGTGKILLNDFQRGVLDLVDGRQSLQDIVTCHDAAVAKTYETLLQLWQFQFIALPSRTQAKNNPAPARTVPERAPAQPLRTTLAPSTNAAIREEVRRGLQAASPAAPPLTATLSETATLESWLGADVLDGLNRVPVSKRPALRSALLALLELSG